jgi:DNA processing protein
VAIVAREELNAIFRLHTVSGVGSKTLWKLQQRFSSFQEAAAASPPALRAAGLPEKLSAALYAAGGCDRDFAGEYAAGSISAVFYDDPLYPPALREIADPPFLLYYIGDLSIHAQPACAVVGTRAPSKYGRTQAKKLAADLARAGIVVVSGMAKGIDGEAHRGALEADGRTTAVWGAGLKHVYPLEHRELAKEIALSGLILSEFPPDYEPQAGFFPIRNRIISGLSRGVLVVEAKAKSGALITADFALEQGREVYALPGPVNSDLSDGPNHLIQQGAKLVLTPDDILEDYGFARSEAGTEARKAVAAPALKTDYDPRFQDLIDLLQPGPRHLDELFQATEREYGDLTVTLLEMEFAGLVARQSGNYYTLTGDF